MDASKRFAKLRERDINKEVFIDELPELGLIVMDSPGDPKPSLHIRDGRVVEMDGRAEADFDAIDRFIAKHAIRLDAAQESMGLDSFTMPEQRQKMLELYRDRYSHRPLDGVAFVDEPALEFGIAHADEIAPITALVREALRNPGDHR